MYYRICQAEDAVRQQLFAFLQRVFESEPAFAADERRLKKAIKSGSCTLSGWRPLSGLKSGRVRAV